MAEVTVYSVGGSYFLRDPETGTVGTYNKDQVRDLLIKGYQPARQVEFEKQEEEKQYDRPGEAALGGFVRGATFGLSDLARAAMPNADLMAAEERKLREYNPTASTMGEIGGTVAGMVVPTGKLGEAASVAIGPVARPASISLGGRLSRIGEKITERMAQKTGTLAEPTTLQKLAGRATAGAAEGAIYGLESGITDVTLAPKEQQAVDIGKMLLSHTIAGAALGGGMTSTFSLMGSLGKYTGQRLGVRGGKMLGEYRNATERLQNIQAKVDDRVSNLTAQASELPVVERQVRDIHSKFDILNRTMGEGAEAKPGVAYTEMVRQRDDLLHKMEEIGGLRQTIEETKIALEAAKKAPKEGAPIIAHAKQPLLDEYESLIQTMKKNKKGSVPELTDLWRETMDELAGSKKYVKYVKYPDNPVRQANSFALNLIGKKFPQGTPNYQRVVSALDDVRVEALGKGRLSEQAKNKLLLEGQLLEGAKGRDLKTIIAEIRAGGAADPAQAALRQDAINQVQLLEQRLADSTQAHRLAVQQFEGWGGQKQLTGLQKSLKSLQSVDDELRETLSSLEQKASAARAARDELAALKKNSDPELLAATQEAAVIGERLKAGKAGLLPKIMRRAIEWQTTRTGMRMLGANARRLGTGFGVGRAAAALEIGRWMAPKIMSALQTGVTPIVEAARYGARGAVAGLSRPVKVGVVKGVLEGEDSPLTDEEFKQVSNELLSTNPDLLRISTSDALQDAPESLVSSVANKEAERWQFLIGKLPQDPGYVRTQETGTVVIPIDKEWKPNRDALLKFSRYLKAAADPRTFVTDLAKQQVSPEAVETMQALYPEILDGLRQVIRKMLREAILKKQTFPASQARQLALFLGQPISNIFPASLILRMQASFGHKERRMPPREGLNIRKTVFSQQTLNPLQLVEARK